jgi:SAM-dependent methyltransferase
MTNVGLGGAFISSDNTALENSVVKLRAQIPNYGILETNGKVLRKQEEGFALKFLNMDNAAKESLWGYISGNLYEQDDFPDNGGGLDLAQPRILPAHRAGEISFRLEVLNKATDVFNSRIEDVEQRLFDGEDPEAILEEVSDSIHEMCDVCRGLEEAVGDDTEFLRKAQAEFREKTDGFFSKSYLMNRARTWPQGYPGDFKMLEAVYRNIPLSIGIGYLLDRHFLSATLAVAVRARLSKLKDIMKEELKDREGPQILNLACGSCREIFELILEMGEADAKVTCLDSDSDALTFASSRLSYAADICSDITMRKYNAIRMLNHERNLKEFGPQDIIYTIGLVNYLPDDMLVRLVKALYLLLKPGGKLIIGIEDGSRYRPQEYHWFVDWASLMGRTEHESKVIFDKAGVPENALTMVRDRTGVIIFCIAEKR